MVSDLVSMILYMHRLQLANSIVLYFYSAINMLWSMVIIYSAIDYAFACSFIVYASTSLLVYILLSYAYGPIKPSYVPFSMFLFSLCKQLCHLHIEALLLILLTSIS